MAVTMPQGDDHRPRAVSTYTEGTTTWTEITPPPWATRIQVSPVTNALVIAIAGDTGLTDGDAYSGAETVRETVAADAKYSSPITISQGSSVQCEIFVRASASTVIELVAEELITG